MATLQGFPFDYRFPAKALANRYRHIGDAVPPLIAFQMSALVKWMKTGVRPGPEDFVMPRTCLRAGDIVPARARQAGVRACQAGARARRACKNAA